MNPILQFILTIPLIITITVILTLLLSRPMNWVVEKCFGGLIEWYVDRFYKK